MSAVTNSPTRLSLKKGFFFKSEGQPAVPMARRARTLNLAMQDQKMPLTRSMTFHGATPAAAPKKPEPNPDDLPAWTRAKRGSVRQSTISTTTPSTTRASMVSRPSLRNRASQRPSRMDRTFTSASTAFLNEDDAPANSNPMKPKRPARKAAPIEVKGPGAHYTWCADPPDLECVNMFNDHDKGLADAIYNRRPSDFRSPLDTEIPMKAAFTDRSMRLNDGRGAKKALMHEDTADTEWSSYVPCECDICEPDYSKPAGNPSHLVQENKTFICGRDTQPSPLHWQTEVPHQNLDSSWMTPTLKHPEDNVLPAFEEFQFTKFLGRRAKHVARSVSPGAGRSLPHRSMSCDALPAGNFNDNVRPEIMAHRWRGRAPFQPSADDQPVRSGMDFVMQPKPGDPPVPTAISGGRKGPGSMNRGFSADTERITLYNNEPIFRFAEANRFRGRAMSVPPNLRNPRTEDGFAGLSSEHMRGVRERMNPASPKPPTRWTNINNNSMCMAATIDQDLVSQYHADYSEARMRCDPLFASLCEHTARSFERTRTLIREFSSERARSCNVADQLVWEG
mmetsp:Transcript_1661/g.3639  ORF Transcript_1661/g.3639 Transcript_1661/m.3639 type:complete len:564 (-) Transcript_1661:201-1892(-)